MGIEFTGLDADTQKRLQQQVEAMAAESETPRTRRARLGCGLPMLSSIISELAVH